MTAYLYRHIRHDKDEPFYVGVGGLSGCDQHRRAHTRFGRSSAWVSVASRCGYTVEILFDRVAREFALEKEKEFIALYGRKRNNSGSLVNLTAGGEGVVGMTHSEETRRRISEIKTGCNHTEATREEMRRTRIGRNARPVIDTETGVIYAGHRVAAQMLGYSPSSLRQYLVGNMPNKTTLRYYDNGEIVPAPKLPTPRTHPQRGDASRARKVVEKVSGKIYGCVRDAAEEIGMSQNGLYRRLAGITKNNTNFEFA